MPTLGFGTPVLEKSTVAVALGQPLVNAFDLGAVSAPSSIISVLPAALAEYSGELLGVPRGL